MSAETNTDNYQFMQDVQECLSYLSGLGVTELTFYRMVSGDKRKYRWRVSFERIDEKCES